MIWDTLLRGLGSILSFFYDVIPSYGVAIILLTILVRLVLLPLTIRQTRSMQAMQRVQPKVKELQRKYKGNRQKLNEELMKLYKEHQVNPLGGCLPLVLQLPVFFALFSVLRTPVVTLATPVEAAPAAQVQAEGTVCRPEADVVVCESPDGTTQSFPIEAWVDDTSDQRLDGPQSFLFRCLPGVEEVGQGEAAEEVVQSFRCESLVGAGHLPRDSNLFDAVVHDEATFLGLHLACSPTQAASDEAIGACAPGERAGGVPLVGYFGLVALMVVTTWYQQRQMQRASQGPQQAQLQLMGRIMPVFLGVISINISTGVLVYWVTTNAWQIGQQYLMLRARSAQPVETGKSAPGPSGSKERPKSSGDGKPGSKPGGQNRPSGGRGAGSRKKRRKR